MIDQKEEKLRYENREHRSFPFSKLQKNVFSASQCTEIVGGLGSAYNVVVD